MIRPAEVRDAIALCHLLNQLGYSLEPTAIKALLSDNHAEPLSAVHVYEREKEAVGFISIVRLFYFPTMQKITRVTALCVDEQHRGLGIGEELLGFAEKLAASYGETTVEVTCSFRRERAHKFYLKQGYSKHSYKFVKQEGG